MQVSLKGSPDKFDGVETGIVTFGDRNDVKMTTFSNPQASFHNKPRRNATATVSLLKPVVGWKRLNHYSWFKLDTYCHVHNFEV